MMAKMYTYFYILAYDIDNNIEGVLLGTVLSAALLCFLMFHKLLHNRLLFHCCHPNTVLQNILHFEVKF